VLKWARANEITINKWETCEVAAGGGHLEMLKWAREIGCSWSEKTCLAAAKGGHLEVLKWARANGCEWDAEACRIAAREGGHAKAANWVTETVEVSSLRTQKHTLEMEKQTLELKLEEVATRLDAAAARLADAE
jgi:hypothetical protein